MILFPLKIVFFLQVIKLKLAKYLFIPINISNFSPYNFFFQPLVFQKFFTTTFDLTQSFKILNFLLAIIFTILF